MATEIFALSTPAERADELVRFVGSAVKDSQTLSSLAEAASTADYVKLVVTALDNQAAIFKNAAIDEIEGSFALMMSLLIGVPEGARTGLVDQMAAASTSSTDAKTSTLRIRILVNLYNASTVKATKLALFSKLIQFATETKHIDALLPQFATAATWKSRWNLTNAEAASLFLLVSNSLQTAGHLEDAQVFLIRYLATFETEPADRRKEAMPAAKKAALNFIKAPAVSQRSNLASLAVVRDMASEPDLARLHQLVDIFSHKTLDSYLAFQSVHGAYLKELGVDEAASMETMRLLTLCTLAASSDALTYDAVATALKVPATEVESWVVRAISAGLVDARMDQQARQLTVLRTTQREFSASQWKELQRKLHAWRDSVVSMSSTLERRGQ